MESCDSKKGGSTKGDPKAQPPITPQPTERVIYCIDLDDEMKNQEYHKKRSPLKTRLDVVKHLISITTAVKLKINPKHEFALAVMTDTTIFFQDFTNSKDTLVERLSSLTTQGSFGSFCMASVFKLLDDFRVPLDPEGKMVDRLPPYTYRLVFIYGRSDVVPSWGSSEDTGIASKYLSSPWVGFDCVYLHKKAGSKNNAQGVFDFIVALETLAKARSQCYIFESTSSLTRLQGAFAKLIAALVQRPPLDSYGASLRG